MAISFTIACKKFFGQKQGESLADFATELKALTDDDRAEMRTQLQEALGEEVSA